MVYYYILMLSILIHYVSVNDEFILIGGLDLSAENGMFTIYMISKDFVDIRKNVY